MSSIAIETESQIIEFVKSSLGTAQADVLSRIQELWSGQGHIIRLRTDASGHSSVVVKYIAPTDQAQHPRGWNTSTSFSRKVRSYEVEAYWYQHYASRCDDDCKVPQLLGYRKDGQISMFLFEDLSNAYPAHPVSLSVEQATVCLRWLAEMHARFLGEHSPGLWPRGCYWHLATRQDEWHAMPEGPLKQAAQWLDEQLRLSHFQTIVHGDAKLANFCFSEDLKQVAALDFQYPGKGCGMSDVAYFLGSCLAESDCERHEQTLLNDYFTYLRSAVANRVRTDPGLPKRFEVSDATELCNELERQWQSLYCVAWTDFYRFLLGWMPEHPKINRYTRQLAARALNEFQHSET